MNKHLINSAILGLAFSSLIGCTAINAVSAQAQKVGKAVDPILSGAVTQLSPINVTVKAVEYHTSQVESTDNK